MQNHQISNALSEGNDTRGNRPARAIAIVLVWLLLETKHCILSMLESLMTAVPTTVTESLTTAQQAATQQRH